MLRKENRNPNHSFKLTNQPKSTVSHSNTPDCSSRLNNYKPKFIKKNINIKEELHSETYFNSPASFTQSTIGMEAIVPNRPKWKEETNHFQKELKERTQKFNASILSFQHILKGINQVICDDTIPGKERLNYTKERISDLLSVFQEFNLQQE